MRLCRVQLSAGRAEAPPTESVWWCRQTCPDPVHLLILCFRPCPNCSTALRCLQALGEGVDVLCANAGIYSPGRIGECSPTHWWRTWEVTSF